MRPFPETEDDDADPTAAAVGAPAEREARMARLRALGIGDAGAEAAADDGIDGPKPVPGITRSVDPVTGRAVGAGRLTGGGSGAAPGLAGAAGAAAGAPAAGRSSGGLARLLGWDRRPRVGASRPARKPERDPAWERPRRFEAYPTLKTRVGLPVPSRLLLALGAVLVAAAILFFVPPLFLKQSGAGPGASGSPAASGSGAAVRTPGASIAPTARPAPTPLTYTVKQGDTLSSIAKKYKLTIEQILAANKAIKNPNKIAPGDVIVIPTPTASDVLDGGASASP
jgi:nucleoid-associated protein YgaU